MLQLRGEVFNMFLQYVRHPQLRTAGHFYAWGDTQFGIIYSTAARLHASGESNLASGLNLTANTQKVHLV